MRAREKQPTYAEVRRAHATAGMLAAIARDSGRPRFGIRTFEGRFRIQKAVYFARRLGEPVAQPYSYGLYVNGPYCPTLAQDYFLLTQDGLAGATATRLANDETARVFAEADAMGTSFMEALATTVSVMGASRQIELAVGYARTLKPHIEAPTWAGVRAFLGAHGHLTGST